MYNHNSLVLCISVLWNRIKTRGIEDKTTFNNINDLYLCYTYLGLSALLRNVSLNALL